MQTMTLRHFKESKCCFKCLETKELDEFYRHPQMLDGHLNKCKECAKRDVRENYKTNHDKIVAYDKKRNRTRARRIKRADYLRRHRARYPQKTRARRKVAYALRNGTLIRQSCTVCGEPKTEAHHPNYNEPLNVVWVCHTHHRIIEGRLVVV